jgi:hypothetical protein
VVARGQRAHVRGRLDPPWAGAERCSKTRAPELLEVIELLQLLGLLQLFGLLELRGRSEGGGCTERQGVGTHRRPPLGIVVVIGVVGAGSRRS